MRAEADESARKVAGESVMAEGVMVVAAAAGQHAVGQSLLLLGEPRHLKVENGRALEEERRESGTMQRLSGR